MKLGLCQMPVTASKTENDTVMRRYVRDAAAAGCDLIVLPEASRRKVPSSIVWFISKESR